MSSPVLVLNTNAERQVGRQAQLSNIAASKSVADIIRTCLGPRAMLKMLLDPMGGIVLTNDGNAILREIEVSHPAAKSMIELSRAQDEEVGDGTTSVIVLAGEVLSVSTKFLEQDIHPIVIISAFRKALDDALTYVETTLAKKVDVDDDAQMHNILATTIGTKFTSRWSDLMVGLALKAVRCVAMTSESGHREVDIKRYARIEKIPGGELEDSQVLDGIMINKDVTHPKMRRHIENPRIILLDCPLEYKKGESQTNIEVSKEADWSRFLELEEEQVAKMCEYIVALKPDIVFTEKGVSDLAQHFLMKANITTIRRCKKMDTNRIARATGATIVNRVEDLKPEDVGTGCGLFEVSKIGDEYFSYLVKCKDPKACTVILRGASKDILNEVERNLHDAMAVARNVFFSPSLLPGGGATEMALSVYLTKRADALGVAAAAQLASTTSSPEPGMDGVTVVKSTARQQQDAQMAAIQRLPYKALATALEVIPRTLIENCGASAIRVLTQLRAKHAAAPLDNRNWGIDGNTGKLVDMADYGVWEPTVVKVQTIKTAVESACMLLRVDDIVSGLKRKGEGQQQQQGEEQR